MKRLIISSDNDINAAKELLNRIDLASKDLKNTYFALFDNLNALYESYPDLYKQIEMVVKLPTNDDAKNITALNSDLERIINNLKDEEYLKSYIVKNGLQ